MDEKSTMFLRVAPSAFCKQAEEAINRLGSYSYENISSRIREHIDQCKACWDKLVSVRWAIAEKSPDMLALQSFLGDDFQYGVDASWKLAEDWYSSDRKTTASIEKFYTHTQWYVYSLVLWEASGQRPKYVDRMKAFILDNSISVVTDFGAGVGNDTLKLADLVQHVEAIEINALCRDFLSFRSKALPQVTVLESSDDAFGGGLLWAMDVIEHLVNPIQTIGPLLEKCKYFMFDCDQDTHSNGRHPFHFQNDMIQIERDLYIKGFRRVEYADEINIFRKE